MQEWILCADRSCHPCRMEVLHLPACATKTEWVSGIFSQGCVLIWGPCTPKDYMCAWHDCRRCSVVTSAFHMPRSRAIFETCFALAGATLWDDPDHLQLDFHAVHDEGLFRDDVLEARCLKERVSLEVRCSQEASCVVICM